MRVFVAGASGVIGKPLVARLIEKGHTVTAMTRRRDRGGELEALGAEPAVCDVYDASSLREAMRRATPEVLVHQLTSLPAAIDPRRIDEQLADNDRIRVEGTRNLVQAAVKAGVGRMVAQSISFAYTPVGGPVKNEDAPLWLDAPWPWRRTVEAVAELENQVTATAGLDGVALRYGYFYGPGTVYANDGSAAAMVRQRQLPIAGRGGGVFSFVHVDDAVSATVAAVEQNLAGIYNVVDDEPSSLRDWLPVYAKALGAPEPKRVFAFLARLAIGRFGLYYMTRQRGATNARAQKEFGWKPRFASWRSGFAAELQGATAPPTTVPRLSPSGGTHDSAVAIDA